MSKINEIKLDKLPKGFGIEKFREDWKRVTGKILGVENNLMELKKKWQIEVLEQHIEHPTKPGYKRSDIIEHIKQLKK